MLTSYFAAFHSQVAQRRRRRLALASLLLAPLALGGSAYVAAAFAQVKAPEGPPSVSSGKASSGRAQPDASGARAPAQTPSWQEQFETARRDQRLSQCLAQVEAAYQQCLAGAFPGGCSLQRTGGILACNAGYNQPLESSSGASTSSGASSAPNALATASGGSTAPAANEAAAAAPASDAIDCKMFDIRSNGVDQQRLRITANGRMIGSYQGSAGPYLTSLLRPGVNTIAFIYDSPGDGNTLLQVYCIPPEAEDRVEILRFIPKGGKLEERVTVNMQRAK